MGSPSVCELLEGENYVLLISDESVASTEQKGRMREKKEEKMKKTVNYVRERGSNEKAHIPPSGKNRHLGYLSLHSHRAASAGLCPLLSLVTPGPIVMVPAWPLPDP